MADDRAQPAPQASPYRTATAGEIDIDRIAALIVRLRERKPRVHSLTNLVAQNFTANLLLAAGAVPSMTIAPDEVADFAARSDALLVNIGTLDPLLREAIPRAIAAVQHHGKPWCFDPVLVDRSDPRLRLARDIVARGPTVIRANQPEFAALAGVAADADSITAYAREQGCVVAITGATDFVTDGERVVRIANGHPLMAAVTAVGCAGTALIAAFTALDPDPLAATIAGLVVLGVAGEIAAERARGPGSFSVELLDALHGLGPEAIAQRAKMP